ncbi:hypothetical protein PHMEG_00035624 [Phytophthora megakarya]|uniref:Uncharacterized protein n=1 Tax=Phytophthora megakarya TaxID=4795 RepID=A0A225UNQ0_9STRA|nr:hypothetical protein PHMEG_00035624 [Phytophthora megakarya]
MALLKAFDQANVTRPRSIPRSTITDSVAVPVFQLDHELIRAISELVTRCNLSLTDTIRLWRGQTLSDPAPTKALSSEHIAWLLHDYELVEHLTRTVNEGVKHAFHVDGTPANTPVPNHTSAIKYHNALIRSIRDGQNTGSYLVTQHQDGIYTIAHLDVSKKVTQIRRSRYG